MDGRTEIRAKLLATPAVTALVGTYDSLPAIFDAPIAPDEYEDAAISMYQTAPVNGGASYGRFQNTVNCWANSYSLAEELQDEVFNALSRAGYGSGTIFSCSKINVIPPQDSGGTDYNAPVEVLVLQR